MFSNTFFNQYSVPGSVQQNSEISIGFKRKFSFSYFRENLFSLKRKKLTKSYENNKNFLVKTKMVEKKDAGNGKYCEIS
jgi:hypothetical protein